MALHYIREELPINVTPCHIQLGGKHGLGGSLLVLEQPIRAAHQRMKCRGTAKDIPSQLGRSTGRSAGIAADVVEQLAERLDTPGRAIVLRREDGLDRTVQLPARAADAAAVDLQHS